MGPMGGQSMSGVRPTLRDIFEPPPTSRSTGVYSATDVASTSAQEEQLEPVDLLSRLCVQGHLAGIESLLEKEGDQLIEQLDKHGYNCLHWAAVNNRPAVVRYLLAKPNCPGPNVVGSTPTLQTPVHWAASRGHVDVLRAFVEHATERQGHSEKEEADLSRPDSQGCPPLHIAVQNGETLAAHFLHAHGAELGQLDSQGHSALHWAASNGTTSTVIYLLRQRQIDLDHVDAHHSTALHWAVIKGHFGAAKLLLQADASTNIKDVGGKTPLDHMRSGGHTRLLQVAERQRNVTAVRGTWRGSNLFLMALPVSAMGLLLYVATFYPWYYLLGTAAALFGVLSMVVGPTVTEKSILPACYAFAGMWWMSTSYFFYLYPLTADVYPLVHNVFIVLNVVMWLVFVRVVRGDPGVIRTPTIDRSNFAAALDDGLAPGNFCPTCLHQRPLRSKHCGVEDHCIARFDHHCPWVATCIGAKNHRFFVIWLMSLSTCNIIGCVVSVLVSFYFVGVSTDASLWQTTVFVGEHHPFLLCCVALNFLHVIWFTALTVSQSYFAVKNVTTNEVMNWARYTYLTGAAFGSPHATNYFDKGPVRNLLDFFAGRHEVLMNAPGSVQNL